MHNDIIHSLFLIFCGAAVLASIALYTRQSLLVAYIILGVILGPWGLNLVNNPVILKDVGDVGIIFLLFLLGLNLQPQNLFKLFRETTVITLLSSTLFGLIGYSIAHYFNFNVQDSILIGTCMMFSSTIIGLKLLPTTVLHHQRVGEIVISILLLQDILAIFVLLILHDINPSSEEAFNAARWLRICLSLPGLFVIAFLAERFILMRIVRRFSRIHEYLFLVALAWCMGIGQLGELLGLSFEIGAFIAGISIAQGPISRFIAESLRPLRDFFLILFFFSLGSQINLSLLNDVWKISLLIAGMMLLIKPAILGLLLLKSAPTKHAAWEIGVRLGQISEFSLLVAYAAERNDLITQNAFTLIQLATIISFIVSSYWVVNVYPNPIAISDKLRRD